MRDWSALSPGLWRSLSLRYLKARFWLERRSWPLIVAVTVLLAMAGFVLLFDEPPSLAGMKGNLISEILGGVVFLLIGIHLGRKVEAIIVRNDERQDQLARMDRFIGFLERERHYNVVFPKLATETQPIGLIYRLEPVRIGGSAVKRETEIETSYVVRVARAAYDDILTPEQRVEYDRSPIKVGGFYFCRFYDGEWHMGPSTSLRDWQEFHLFSKHGQMERSLTAEEFYAAAKASEDARASSGR